MSFYAPSFVGQILIPAGAILGIAISLYAMPKLELGGIITLVVSVAAALLGGGIALFAHGYKLTFDAHAPTLVVCTRLFGIALEKRTYSYDDIRSLKLIYDGDGCAIISLELVDGGKYSFCRRNTRQEFERLCAVVGREFER